MKNSLYLFFAITLLGCSKDDNDSSQKFRNIYNNTFWNAGPDIIKFSTDKLAYNYDEGGQCYY